MDWKKIEDKFANWHLEHKGAKSVQAITAWFKETIESELLTAPTIEDKIEYESVNVTADIKVNYGK